MALKWLAAACLALTAHAQTWTPTGSMAEARRDHTATLLVNGKVLIVGWFTPTAELYDPATGTFSPTGNTQVTHGSWPSATRLLDGRVLIVGGWNAPFVAEIYDPATGSFSPAASPNAPRISHSATLLANGKVLIAAGQDSTVQTHAFAELYDPVAGSFTPTGSLNAPRSGHSAALLQNGKVLIAGGIQTFAPAQGNCLNSAELYDPALGSFTSTGNMSAARCLRWPEAPVLSSGKVLVAGGSSSSAELYDPANGAFSPTGSMTVTRGSHTASLLPDGKVLIAGGSTAIGPITTNSAELYDPASGTFSATASMGAARQEHTATLLPDGRVLVTGGYGGGTELSSAELYFPSCSDVLAPTLFVSLNPNVLSPPNRSMRTVNATITVADDCDPSPSVILLSITADGPDIPNPPAGPLAGPDIQGANLGADDREFLLRAEINANGRPRVYTVTYRAQDLSGKTTTTIALVTVGKTGP